MKRIHWTSPLGPICIEAEGDAVTALYFCGEADAAQTPDAPSPLLEAAAAELEEYFAGRRRSFTIPASPCGTAFQQAVWDALRAIPCGEVRTYGQIAAAIGRPKAARAVGNACNRNPVAILIPCHRVVGASGSLTGYAGGLDKKAALLALEGAGQG